MTSINQVQARLPRALPLGVFFGDSRKQLRTASFVFSRLLGTCPEEEVPRHSHPEAHFVSVLRGTYITEARNTDSVCGPSTLIFNPSGTTHRDRFRSRDGSFFAMSLCKGIEGRVERTLPCSTALQDLRVSRTVWEACVEIQYADDLSSLVLEGLGLEILGRAARSKAMRDKRPPRWLLSSREHIRDCCTRSISIGEIARLAAVHPVHLARAFRQYFGCSPGQFVRSCRVEKACRLFAASRLPLAEIAQEAGFADQSQLTHAVKRLTGSTPGELRRALQP